MREKFYRFMQGRYGQDEFSRFLLCGAVVCILINIYARSNLLYVLAWVLLFYSYFRSLSKNYQARYKENRRYLDLTARMRRWSEQQKKLMEERKFHRIYTCPQCRQKIRIPKGKGRIMVRCPKCSCEFQRRS